MNKLSIAGYCRISVDDELDRDNTSIENQKDILSEFAKTRFPEAELTFYEDRDRSGYTFEQREGYQKMRRKLMSGEHSILVIKDFSRFSRRNSKGLVELEDLRDRGVRIIAIGDGIDYPTNDDWIAIQFRFLVNEMPVTDTSKKVKSVIASRQKEGRWICAVPFGYTLTNSKKMTVEIDEGSAAVVREIFDLYKDGWGYKRIANYLTDKKIPTPRMTEKLRREAEGEDSNINASETWSVISVSEILHNDFYIGTLRQGKYKRKKINGSDIKTDESDHIVFENHHPSIIDFRTFAAVQNQLESRTQGHYRGTKKYDNVYSGFMFCGDCGAPMFSVSSAKRPPAYTCGTYHKRGLKGCTSHHIKCETLDGILKDFITKARDSSTEMLKQLDEALKEEKVQSAETGDTIAIIRSRIEDTKAEMKLLARQKVRDIARNPENEELLDETYGEMQDELANRISSLENQIALIADKHGAVLRVNRTAKAAIDIFDDIIAKKALTKADLDFIIDRITVYDSHIDIQLKSNIDTLLRLGLSAEKELNANFNPDTVNISQEAVQSVPNRRDKVIRVNVVREGDPLEIYTSPDGEVIFRKYSPVGEISGTATQYADVLSKVGGCPAVICDRDHVIAVSGMSKKEVIERRVSGSLEDLIEQRKTHFYKSREDKRLNPIEGIDRYAIACAPILSQGDVNGAVIMLAGDNNEFATGEQSALVQAAAMYFGKQMEE